MISPIKNAKNQKIFTDFGRSIFASHGLFCLVMPVFASHGWFSPRQLGRLPVFASACLFLPWQAACFLPRSVSVFGAEALTRQDQPWIQLFLPQLEKRSYSFMVEIFPFLFLFSLVRIFPSRFWEIRLKILKMKKIVSNNFYCRR